MIELDKNAIAKVVKQLHKEKGMSQEVCSGLADIARSHLAMIENSSKIPNFETLWKLSFAFDLTPHEFVKLIEEKNRDI